MDTTQATTECKQHQFEFQGLGSRRVGADFSGGYLSSDGGSLLLREAEHRQGLCRELAACFSDHRDPDLVEHPLEVMLRQRILGLALGYEDLNDHEQLRHDPLLAAACGQADVLGQQRRLPEDRGKALAGKSTLNRLELGAQDAPSRLRRIQPHAQRIEALLLKHGVSAIPRRSQVIVLDFDATDVPLHGHQEGRFYHGYYRNYCYLPLYCFCGDIALWAQLRTADRDASDGTLEALQTIVAAIRERFGRQTVIIVRGDSGFCRDELMSWIEAQERVHYVFGLARNPRLQELLLPSFWETAALLDKEAVDKAKAAAAPATQATPPPPVEGTARVFAELRYRTLKSWSVERRVIGKAEITTGKHNPRFIVTDLTGQEPWAAGQACFKDGRGLYEEFYCARGGMENCIKEQQLDLFAGRTSTAHLSSNQLRLWFCAFAHLLMGRLRAGALQGTRLAQATVGTIRLRLLKIAAQVSVSVRRIHVRLCNAYPMQEVFARAHLALRMPEV